MEFFFRFFGSYLPAGNIAVLNFGLRLMLVLVGVFGQAVGTASFPYMARLAAENDIAEMNRLLNRTLRYLALVIPFSVFLMVLSPEVVRVLFQRGRFDPAATRLTADVLVWLLAGAFAFSAYTVVVRGYFATRNTLFPAVFGSIAVLASIPVYALGVKLWQAQGLALAISLSGILQVAVLFALWSRRSGNTGRGDVYRFYLKTGLLSLALAPLLIVARWWVSTALEASSTPGSLIVMLTLGALFAGIMLLAGHALKIPEITLLASRLLRLRKE
jgi:putative peptidoglycan lipid II flippase